MENKIRAEKQVKLSLCIFLTELSYFYKNFVLWKADVFSKSLY